jgi:hypothetical protein
MEEMGLIEEISKRLVTVYTKCNEPSSALVLQEMEDARAL